MKYAKTSKYQMSKGRIFFIVKGCNKSPISYINTQVRSKEFQKGQIQFLVCISQLEGKKFQHRQKRSYIARGSLTGPRGPFQRFLSQEPILLNFLSSYKQIFSIFLKQFHSNHSNEQLKEKINVAKKKLNSNSTIDFNFGKR